MKTPSFIAPYVDGDAPARLFQGLAVGVIATLVVGFNWGGWELGSTVEDKVSAASEAAMVSALAPICADKFQLAAQTNMDLVPEFKAVSSWQRDSHLTKAGWATFPGGAEPDNAVAEACAVLLAKALELTS
jgi:hypothetical protein